MVQKSPTGDPAMETDGDSSGSGAAPSQPRLDHGRRLAGASIVSNEAMYGPFGAVMTLVTAEIGLGVAVQLGAIVGATAGRGRDPAATARTDAGRRPAKGERHGSSRP
jgi:hypothetical protein